jgi:hypothetical protein
MAHFWRLSLVVFVLTFAPMQAWAECAWVLWVKVMEKNKPGSEWAVVGAYTGPAAGTSMRGAMAKSACEREGKTLDRDDTVYLCLPDTVDPRGPKAGTR